MAGDRFLTDRKAFMIISGGVNIYPQEPRTPTGKLVKGKLRQRYV
nr:hypothetical protein [Nocardia abscessus]